MSVAAATTKRLGNPGILAPRWARLLRAAVLVAIGLAVTFTATLHEEFAFDSGMISAGLVLIGLAHGVEWVQQRGQGGAPVTLLLGIVAVAAGVLIFTIHTELSLALVVAAWALMSALLEFVGMTVVPGSRQDAPIIGAAGVLLAITTLLARNDLVAVIGFFGAYSIIAGVFLGIAALDTRKAPAVKESGVEPEIGDTSQTSPAAGKI